MKKQLQITDLFSENYTDVIIEAKEAFVKLGIVLKKMDRRSRLEKAYDFMTNLLSDGKSFSPNELKSF